MESNDGNEVLKKVKIYMTNNAGLQDMMERKANNVTAANGECPEILE